MDQTRVFQPNADLTKSAHIDAKTYETRYAASIANPDQFWAEQGQRLDWIKPYSQISDVSYNADDLHIKWYADGTLNAASNCLDRHLAERGDQMAIIWEGDNPETTAPSLIANCMRKSANFRMSSRQMAPVRGSHNHLHADDPRSGSCYARLCAVVQCIQSSLVASPSALAGRILDCGQPW